MNQEEFIQHVHDFLLFQEVEKNAAAHTLRAYRADLHQVIKFWHELSTKEKGINHRLTTIVRRYIVSLFYRKIKKSTLARKLACLKSLKSYLQREGIRMTLHVKTPRIQKKLPTVLTVDEIFYLLDTVKTEELPSRFPYRDKAIFEFIYASGVRCAELVNLKMSDINFAEKTARIVGKGRKERIVLFGKKAKSALFAYFEEERNPLVHRKKNQYVFLNHRGTCIRTRSVQRIFEMFRSFLKVDRMLTPHCVRHSFATHLLAQGVDLRVIQELLGHATIDTTELYTKITPHELWIMCDEKHPINSLDHVLAEE